MQRYNFSTLLFHIFETLFIGFYIIDKWWEISEYITPIITRIIPNYPIVLKLENHKCRAAHCRLLIAENEGANKISFSLTLRQDTKL